MKKNILSNSIYLILFAAFFLLMENDTLAQRTQGTWTAKDTMGSGRFWAFSFAMEGKVYGGTGRPMFSSLTPLSDFWEYDPATDSWTQKADFPGGVREGATGFTANGRGFAGFGSPFIQFSKDLYEYFPATNTWSRKADVPGIGFAFSSGFVLDSIYYIGPENGTNRMLAYNVNTDMWDTAAVFPGNDRRAQVTFALQGKGYLGMGAGVFSGVYGDFWAYDPTVNRWTQVADIFPKSDQSTAFSIGNYGYVVNAGGTGGGGKNTYRYDPVADIWEFEASLPDDRIANGTSCALDSAGYLLFGERSTSMGNFSSHRIYEFRPGHDNNMAIDASLAAQAKVSLYPVSQALLKGKVEGEMRPARAQLRILDMTGKTIAKQEISIPGSFELSVGHLPQAMYILHLEQAGKTFYAQKWLK